MTHTPTPWEFDGNCGGYVTQGGDKIARAYARDDAEFIVKVVNDCAAMVNMHDHMQEALRLFQIDHADSDFQRGYHEALKVFANEAMGFAWDDPLLWGTANPAPEKLRKPKFTVIDGGGT